MSQVKTIASSAVSKVGEGPHWMEKDKALVYLDIYSSTLYRYFPETERHQTLIVEDTKSGRGETSFVIPFENKPNRFLISFGNNLGYVDWPTTDPDIITKTPQICSGVEKGQDTRFNDGKCDPHGRLWAGTMARDTNGLANFEMGKGSLYSIDAKGDSKKWVDKISISNGIAFSNERNHMYYIDSFAYSVDSFHYDGTSGSVDDRQVVLDFKTAGLGSAIPDGMTTDINGNLWVACYDAYMVICIDPAVGRVVRKVYLPCRHITSVCWGGPDYATLYATSASRPMAADELPLVPEAGKLFEIKGLGSKGMRPFSYKCDN